MSLSTCCFHFFRALMKIFRISPCQVSLKIFLQLAVIYLFLSVAHMNHLMHCAVLFQKHKEISSIFFITTYMYSSLSCSKCRFVYIFLERASLKDCFVYSENQINHSGKKPVLIIKIFIAPFPNKYLLILCNTFVSPVHSSQLSFF